MLNGELTPRSNLIGELTGGVFYGTNDYEELINKPSINGVELVGNKTTSDLGIDIPTELSELTNDVGFITSADVPTKTSDLTNDSGYITSADVSAAGLSGDYDDLTNKPTIPTLTSQLTNDSGFITNAQVPTMTSQLFNDSGFITSADVPTKTSELENDSGFITSSDIPTDVSAFENDAGYISNSDLMTATASGSIATFDNGGNGIPVSEFECEIVAQQASGTPTPVSPLPISGFSQADISVMGKNLVDETQFVQGSISGTGEDTVSYTRLRSPLTMVKPNTAYAFATNSALLVFEIHEYDKNGTWFQYTNINNTSGTITTTANTGYIKILVRNSTNTPVTVDELTTFQMEKGNVASAYAPYISPNLYTVAFGQTIYGGKLVYKNGQWAIEATHGIVDLGDLDWRIGYDVNRFVTSDLVGVIQPPTDNDSIADVKCSIYSPISINNMLANSPNNTMAVATSSNLSILDNRYSSETDFKTAMTGILLVYELATPTIIPITSSTRVKTISGDNNIYSSTGDCELKYFTDKADNIAELIKAFL